jgi:hypothetical protein
MVWVDDETKKWTKYSIVALDGRRLIILYTTTNQKHVERANDGTDRRWDRGGARVGQHNTIVFGCNRNKKK